MPSPKFKGNTSTLIEQKDSGKYVFGDKIQYVQIYRAQYALCVSSALPKWTVGTGATAGYHVDTCEVDKEDRGIGKLTINWVASSSDSGASLPPDEIDLSPFEINPALEKNSFFTPLTDSEIRSVRKAFENLHLNETIAYPAGFSTLQKNLLTKLTKGTTNFYLAGIKYSWTQYGWGFAGTVSLGGFIDTPAGPLTGALPGSLSAIRQADGLAFTGQYYKYTKTWLLAPSGHWDTDLY